MVASTSTTGSCSGKAPLPASAEPPQAAALHAELRSLMASSRQRLAGTVNAELTRLGEQLAQEFGRGFEAKNLRRMVQFAQAFPLPGIVATQSRPLSWSHFVNLLPLKTEPARQFYANQAKNLPLASSCAPNPAANRWSCCKCTKTASPWPNTGPNCLPKRSWSKSCMQRCLKSVSGWRGAGCCWEVELTPLEECMAIPSARPIVI